MSRNSQRAAFAEGVRITLLEGDADVVDARMENIENKLDRIYWAMVMLSLTILGGVVTGSIVFLATNH